MSKPKLYAPILKWKSGEQVALQNLQPEQKSLIIPVLEFVDRHESVKILKELEACYNLPVYVDTSYIDQDGEQHLTSLIEEANKIKKELYPVVYYDDFPELANKLSTITSRMLLRIPVPEEIDGPDYTTIFETVANWGRETPVNLDVMLDLSVIANKREAQLLLSTLNILINQHLVTNPIFDRIILAMTCFPENLSSISSGEAKFFERYELKLFQKVLHETNSNIKKKLIFSDYGVTKFTDTDLNFSKMRYGPLPKIRYTTHDYYWVLKGAKNRITGEWIRSRQAMANEILESEYYYGEHFSFGDLEIKERALGEKGPGGNTNWVTIDTNHHITVVIEELSSLFGF